MESFFNMKFVEICEKHKNAYNESVTHPLQSFEWGNFRKKTGVEVVRRGVVDGKKIKHGFSMTLHTVPKLPFTIGYLPKGLLPTKHQLNEIQKIGKERNCVFVQLEPNIEVDQVSYVEKFGLVRSFHPLFTKYNFVLDISKSEKELLAGLHSKTRYNIRVAQKHNVWVEEDNSRSAFEEYLKLTQETTKRQGFYAHNEEYHRTLFETLSKERKKNTLSYHLLRACYKDTPGTTHTLAVWVVFIFGNTLYYPYGASSGHYRFTMASNLLAWEAIRFGKKHKCTSFDMWGALPSDANSDDAWYGFHRFKRGYGGRHVEYAGSFDYVINPTIYSLYKIGDKVRWAYLGIKKKL